jgi:DNA repair exonuclease SbcCD nuclease subunit
VKLLHCSDAMIGMAFPHAYEKADKLRQYRMEALKSAISLARRERAEAIILAGNTLADNRISPNQLKELSATLSGSSIPFTSCRVIPTLIPPTVPFVSNQGCSNPRFTY